MYLPTDNPENTAGNTAAEDSMANLPPISNADAAANTDAATDPGLLSELHDSNIDVDIDDPFAEESNRFGFLTNQNTLLVAIVVVIAAGSLYGMRLMQGNLAANTVDQTVEAKIEQALIKLTSTNAPPNHELSRDNLNELFDTPDQAVAMLTLDRTTSQVPVQFIKKNPFALKNPTADDPTDAEKREAEEAEKLAKAHERKVRRLRAEADKMKLDAIMPSRTRPVAMIDGELVKVGQTLGKFEVKAIRQLDVLLAAEGEVFTLSLETENTPR